MERFGWLTGSRVIRLGAMALTMMIIAAPRMAMAQDAAAPAADPLKFTSNAPLIVGFQVKADKTADFEGFWSGIRALIAKTDNAELKAFGETLTKISRVDQPPYDAAGTTTKVVLYLFHLDAPSTTFSYRPDLIVYTYLGAGVEGSKLTRAEADPLYKKFTDSFVSISPLWKLIKVN